MKKNKDSLRIKDWAPDDRPREKLLAKGLPSLSNAELLSILIGSGNKNENALELAKKILSHAKNDLSILGKLDIDELRSIHGIGTAKSISIMAALELGRRRKKIEIDIPQKICGSFSAFEFLKEVYNDLKHEEFWILLLNRSNNIIDKIKISQGGISATIIDIRIILSGAIKKLATSIILSHNHPSGNLNPSNVDIDITKKIINGANLLDIKILDHLIICDNQYYSFKDEGLI